MKTHPIFIQGDEITFSTMTNRLSRVPSHRRIEDHHTTHGFFIGNVDRDYSVMHRFLHDLNVDQVDQSSSSGVMITVGGSVMQTYFSPGRRSDGDHVAGVIYAPKNPEQIVTFSRAAEDHQCIDLAIKMGYNTVPKLLNMLDKVTFLNVKYYVTLKISDIAKEFKERGTLPYYGYYLRHKESIDKILDERDGISNNTTEE